LHYDLFGKTDYNTFIEGCEKVINGIINYKSEMIKNVPD
ncbi:MAG: hypothetical protein JWQ25_3238, partial [Daejeonella sp.]|nr:hypothetical protein [Daejeonella sp.]